MNLENTGSIGTDGSYDVKFDASLKLTATANVKDAGGSSVGIVVVIDLADELLALAKKSGSSEALTIVQGLISIMPLVVGAVQSAPPVANP